MLRRARNQSTAVAVVYVEARYAVSVATTCVVPTAGNDHVVERIADAKVVPTGGTLRNEERVVLVVADHLLVVALLYHVLVPDAGTARAGAVLPQLSAVLVVAKARIPTQRSRQRLLVQRYVRFVVLTTSTTASVTVRKRR